MHNTRTGKIRFRSMSNSSVADFPAYAPSTGQLPDYSIAPSSNFIYFALLKNIPGEGGNTNNRDDVIVYDAAKDSFARFDARFAYSSYQTYWWAYTVKLVSAEVSARNDLSRIVRLSESSIRRRSYKVFNKQRDEKA